MKTPSLLFTCFVISLMAWPAWADKYGTLAGVGDSVTLLKGETALVIYASSGTELLYQKGNATAVRFTIGGNNINNISPLPLVGPATISCRNTDVVVGFRVVSTTASNNDLLTGLPSTSVVIPSDGAGGGAEVLLESSPDMVTWTPALPGTYGANSECRFFRVRVLRNQ